MEMLARPLHRDTIPAWARGVGSAFAGLAVGLLLAAAVVTVLATQFFNFHVLAVSSSSMAPKLSKGDVVITRPANAAKLTRGDIILYRANEDVSVIHRVAGVNKVVLNLTDSKTGKTDTSTTYQFVTKGDANAAADSVPVDQHAVQGELWFELPGVPGDFAGLRLQWLFLVVAVALAGSWAAWEFRHRLTRRTAGNNEES